MTADKNAVIEKINVNTMPIFAGGYAPKNAENITAKPPPPTNRPNANAKSFLLNEQNN